MTWKISFYKGVDDDLLNLPPKIQARIIRLLELIEDHGPNLGPPHTKALGDGLFEIRAKATEGIGRGIFCHLQNDEIYVLNIFVKKSQKTPRKEL
ncbi:MAG: hypothetical protein B7X54_08115, partial [Idiomarina sp. 34-48-12]